MNELRIGIIGCGAIAETHAWAIEENEGSILTALCDINPVRLNKMKGNRDCLLFNDWKDMLRSDKVDAVAICLPHHLHEPALLEAFEAGKHVICEKPLAISLDQLRKMKEAALVAEERGVYSFGIFQHRYSPLIREIGKILREKSLGQIQSGSLSFLCTRDSFYYGSDDWRGRWQEEGGGTLINQGIHTLDVLQYLIGNPEGANFKLFREKLDCIEVEDRGEGSLHYSRETIGEGSVNIRFENDLATDWEPEISIQGTKGSITIKGSEDFTCTSPDLNERLSAIGKDSDHKAPGKACYGSLHSENYRDIINSIALRSKGEQHKPLVSLQDLAETTETVFALYQSHFQNKKITLPLGTWEEPRILDYTGE